MNCFNYIKELGSNFIRLNLNQIKVKDKNVYMKV